MSSVCESGEVASMGFGNIISHTTARPPSSQSCATLNMDWDDIDFVVAKVWREEVLTKFKNQNWKKKK